MSALWSGQTMNFLYEAGNYGVLSFLILTIVMGGAAAMATGRALASTWRPVSHAVWYSIPLSAAVAFLHYVFFEEPVIPLELIGEELALIGDMPASAVAAIAWYLRGWAAFFVILSLFGLLGFRLKRVRQMNSQYHFAFESAGPFTWRAKAAKSPDPAAKSG